MDELNPLWWIPIFPIFFVGLWLFICLILSKLSGWRSLAEAYPQTITPEGQSVRCRFAQIGISSYKNALRLTAGHSHLHIVPLIIFRFGHLPLSIPWADITATEYQGSTLQNRFSKNWELRLARVPNIRILIDSQTYSKLVKASGRLPPPKNK